MEELKSRIWISLLGIVVLTLVIYFSSTYVGSIIFTVFLACLIAMTQWEFYQLTLKKQLKPFIISSITLGVFYSFTVYLGLFYLCWNRISLLVLAASVFWFFIRTFYSQKDPVERIGTSLLGIAYIAIPITFFTRINFASFGPNCISGSWWLMFLIIVTKACDVGAYIVGKTIGKTNLAPKISPKKTLEGLIGGIVFSMVASFALIYLNPNVSGQWGRPWIVALIYAFILSVIGQISDMSESILKRDAEVKDSNRIKGFGGILDMMDSMIFTTPIFFLILSFWEGA